ncbi:MAG: glycosyltransferase family 2 protein [Chthonomonadales bacterium]|nr:glycosyltransferase family 2 protein [Chthonomonadales bacterium]
MDLSVIIVNWNVRDLLRNCLRSLHETLDGVRYEVIVVDNASRDDSAAMVRAEFPGARLVENRQNAGFCRGNNQGIALARGRYVVLLNPDTEVREGALQRLMAFLDEHRDVGVVGPMLLTPTGEPAPTGSCFPGVLREAVGVLGLHNLYRARYDLQSYGRTDFTGMADVDVICGACLMTRSEVLDRIGGLDEDLFMFFDEVDFCRRARKAGWRAVYVPEARVLHVWMGSVRQDALGAMRRFYRAQFVYFRKHHGLAAALLLRVLGLGALAGRAARITGVRWRDALLRGRGKPGPP